MGQLGRYNQGHLDASIEASTPFGLFGGAHNMSGEACFVRLLAGDALPNWLSSSGTVRKFVASTWSGLQGHRGAEDAHPPHRIGP